MGPGRYSGSRRRPRCKRRDLSGWRWRGFSWPDGWPSSAQQSHMHSRFMPTHHRHSHRRPSIHRRHTLCLNRPRPRFHQDCQAPFRDHPRGSRLRVEVHPARSFALIGGQLPPKADIALGIAVRTGAAGVKPAVSEAAWGVCGAFESANRCNAEWSPRSHRCGCIMR